MQIFSLFKNKKILLVAALVILVIVGFYKITSTSQSKVNPSPKRTSNATSSPTAIVDINKSFEFDTPNKKDKITYTLTSAELKNDIKVKGELRKAASGKNYLLIRLEINNPTTVRTKLISADFIRLVSDDKKFAPDYHNGVVDLDPISVKKDLVAFAVSSGVKNFTFQVGELDKEKETIEVEFK